VRALTPVAFASLAQVNYFGGATHADYRDPTTNTQTVCPINKCLFIRSVFGRWLQIRDDGSVGPTSQAQEVNEPELWECFYFRQQSSNGCCDANGNDKFFLFNPAHSRYLWGTKDGSVGSQPHGEGGEQWRIHREAAPSFLKRIIIAAKENDAAHPMDQLRHKGNGDGEFTYGSNGEEEKFFIRDIHGHAACNEPPPVRGRFHRVVV